MSACYASVAFSASLLQAVCTAPEARVLLSLHVLRALMEKKCLLFPASNVLQV